MRALISKRGLVALLVLLTVSGLSAEKWLCETYGQDTTENTPPVACISDGDRTIEAAGEWEARVTLDGGCSSDADSAPGTNDDINDFKWYELVDVCDPNRNIFLGSGEVIECNLPLGLHVIILKVTDGTGASDSNEAVFAVEYMPPLPPMIEPNEANEPNSVVIAGGDSNNTEAGTASVLAAGPGVSTRPGKVIGWGSQAAVDLSSGLIAVAAGGYHSLALKSDGSIAGWGYSGSGQAKPPSGNNFTAIAAGYNHSLALKSDGSIVCWGSNGYGQATPPSGSSFTAIAAGYWHSLALKSDGSIVGWGRNNYGQATPPVGNSFIAIAAGEYHSLALKSDGSIVGWGRNNYGQATPPAGKNFVAISAGELHSLALKSDGSIVGWGDNSDGQRTPPAGNNYVAIAAGGYHSLALKSNGSIVGWGNNSDGQRTPPAGNYVAIAAGDLHSLALKSDGSIVGWGYNYFGQARPPSGSNFTAIAAGGYHSLALKSDRSIVGWGNNLYGQATPPAGNNFVAISAGTVHSLALKSYGSIVGWGNNEYNGQATPPAGNNYVAIAAGNLHSLALKSDGSIVGWGWNNYGQARPPAGNNFIAIATGYSHSLAIKSDGSIVGWGDNGYGQARPPSGNSFTAIAAGGSHSLALKSDGSIVGWGDNYYGQAKPPAGNNFIAIAAGMTHSLALKSDGSIVGWGRNNYGQATPPSGKNFTAIAAGRYHSLAIIGENRAPVACVAGGDRIIEEEGNCQARVVLDGSCSSDADSAPGTNDDINDFDWYQIIDPCDPDSDIYLGSGEVIECNLPVGEHIIVLEVTDKAGASDRNEAVINVIDTAPPVLTCPPDMTVYARLPAGAAVAFEVNAVDLCDSQVEVVSSPASGSVFAPGQTPVVCTATDDSGNSSTCSFQVTVIAPVEMAMQFTPQAINPGSRGNWVKAHFVLPEGYEIGDVDVNTPAVLEPLGIESEYITVFVGGGGLGESGVEIGFQRRRFCEAVGDYGPGGVTVSGRLTSGRYFYGTDTIRITENNLGYLAVFASHWLQAGCGRPDWCSGADLDGNSVVDFADFALFDGCCIEVIRE